MNRSFAMLIILASILFCTVAYGEKIQPAQTDAPSFTNKDLEQYRMSSDNKTPDMKKDRTEAREEKARARTERQNQEYWCKKATSYNRKIEKGRDEVSALEKDLADENLSHKKRAPLEKKLTKARKQLIYLEKDLTDFEDEARRKDVPPGWLRCQFE